MAPSRKKKGEWEKANNRCRVRFVCFSDFISKYTYEIILRNVIHATLNEYRELRKEKLFFSPKIVRNG